MFFRTERLKFSVLPAISRSNETGRAAVARLFRRIEQLNDEVPSVRVYSIQSVLRSISSVKIA